MKILKRHLLDEIASKLGFCDVGTVSFDAYLQAVPTLEPSFHFAKTILCFALPYDRFDPVLKKNQWTVAKFAYGRDYHRVMESLLMDARILLKHHLGSFESKITVDATILDEKKIATLSGIGFLGKNNLVISPKHGSFFVLGELLVDFEVDGKTNPKENGCGNCTKCKDACPTQAISDDFERTKCLSYLTQKKHPFSSEAFSAMGSSVFGCDICQNVCPYNQKTIPGHPDLMFDEDSVFTLPSILALNATTYKEKYEQKTFQWIKYEVILRNVIIASVNSKSIEIDVLMELQQKYRDMGWMNSVLEQSLERMK